MAFLLHRARWRIRTFVLIRAPLRPQTINMNIYQDPDSKSLSVRIVGKPLELQECGRELLAQKSIFRKSERTPDDLYTALSGLRIEIAPGGGVRLCARVEKDELVLEGGVEPATKLGHGLINLFVPGVTRPQTHEHFDEFDGNQIFAPGVSVIVESI